MATKTKFSIRDLLWLTTLVAVLLGWFLHDRAWRDFQNQQVRLLTKEAYRLNVEIANLGSNYRELEAQNTSLQNDNRVKGEWFSKVQKTLHDSIQDKNK